jgi:hypothetical protein
MSGSHGVQESSSSQRVVPKTGAELELQGIQLDFAQQALDAFRNQSGFQALQQGIGTAATRQLGGAQDLLSALPPEERAGFVRQMFDQSLAGEGC